MMPNAPLARVGDFCCVMLCVLTPSRSSFIALFSVPARPASACGPQAGGGGPGRGGGAAASAASVAGTVNCLNCHWTSCLWRGRLVESAPCGFVGVCAFTGGYYRYNSMHNLTGFNGCIHWLISATQFPKVQCRRHPVVINTFAIVQWLGVGGLGPRLPGLNLMEVTSPPGSKHAPRWRVETLDIGCKPILLAVQIPIPRTKPLQHCQAILRHGRLLNIRARC